MTEALQHDPRTKQQIKDALHLFLYTPVEKEFERRLEALATRNAIMGRLGHKSFMYRNVLYNYDPTPLPRKMNRLVPALHEEMNEFLKERRQLNEHELPFVMGFINQVLNSSNDLCDYYRLLPTAVHEPLRKLIATCPCRNQKLPEEVVELLQTKNQGSIDLMKQRMVANLLY